MDINTFVDSKGTQLKVGQKVRFKTQHGYQNCYTIKGEGVITRMDTICQIQIKIPFTYMQTGRYSQSRQTDIVTMSGDYDFDTKKVVFGKCQNVVQFDFPTQLNRYCEVIC